ncbi:MAG: hypothetical protein HY675_09680 [Chloroflexi bacterium]|nr:hypothetical protein [Chloroflexota bacterium]
MGRPRKYESAAEKQAAYRDRLADNQFLARRIKRPPRKSRPERLAAVSDELRELARGYQHWLDTLPDNLSSSDLAEQLEQVIEQLEGLAADVDSIDPPRGFGR